MLIGLYSQKNYGFSSAITDNSCYQLFRCSSTKKLRSIDEMKCHYVLNSHVRPKCEGRMILF